MARNRPRVTQRAKWKPEAMAAAIKAVKEQGKKLRETARFYNIPVMTLRDRIQTNNCNIANLGRNPTFSKDHEDDISQQVLTLAKLFYGITPIELRRLVYEYAETNKIKHNFNTSSRMAGWDWLQGFLKRNPTVRVRKPEATSLDRITAFNIDEVKLFYSNLKSVMEKNSFSPSKIFNFDETGISTVQKPGNILGPKGVKQLGAATSWERGKNITICCAISAAGTYIPPMFIFPRQRMSPLLQKDGPINAIYQCSKNGWITEDLFLAWLDHFILFSKPTNESPVLLIIDNHTTHVTLGAYNKFKENYIVVVTIPPHTSHRLQPLDVVFYSPLKAAFNRECDSFMKANTFAKITPYDIASLFNKAYSRVANIEKGVSGFKKTGIFPLDAEKFSEEDFAALTPKESELVSVCDQEPPETVSSTGEQLPRIDLNCNQQSLPSSTENEKQIEHSSPGFHPLCLPSTSTQALGHCKNNPTVPFSKISPLPCVQKTSKNVNSRKQHSSVFTLTPNKINLELAALEKEDKRKRKEENILKKAKQVLGLKLKPKGNSQYRKNDSKCLKTKLEKKKITKRLCRRNISFNSSEDEETCNDVLLCDDNEMDDVEPHSFGDSTATSGKDLPEDALGVCCLLCLEIGRDLELWYRCVSCANWVHAECSGADTAENYICDYCKTE